MAGDTSGHTRLTVAAFDDDDLVLMSTVTMLEDLGFRVLEAPSGAEVLQSLSDNQVDLVITDWGMPRMTGTATKVVDKRRRAPQGPSIEQGKPAGCWEAARCLWLAKVALLALAFKDF